MVEFWQNKIPLSAVIFEIIMTLFLLMVTIFLWRKYVERKKKPVFILGMNFTLFTAAAIVDTIGRCLGYFTYPNTDYLLLSYTDFTTLLNYAILAVANCFVIIFIDEVFLHKGTNLTLPFGVLNGLVIGLIIPALRIWSKDTSFGLLREKIGEVIVFAVVSLVIYGMLAFFAIREGVLNDEKLPKVGFHLIGTYGVCLVLMFLSFAGDTIIIQIVPSFSQGYSPFFYIGFSLSMIGIGLCYLGYLMPTWFKNLIT